MNLGQLFSHNAPLMMFYMVVIMSSAFIGVSPQFSKNRKMGISFGGLSVLTFMMAMFPIQSADFVYTAQYFLAGNFEHFEDFYVELYYYVNSIILWRVVVFGCTTLLLYFTVKLLNVNNKFAAFIFAITQMFMFGALRNMFGIMLMFLGITVFLYNNKNKTVKCACFVFGLLALYLCTFLHRSMIIYVLLAVIAYAIPLKKRIIQLSLISFPIIWCMVYTLSAVVISNLNDPDLQQSATYYAEAERATTIMKTLNELLKHGAYIYLLTIIIKKLLTKNSIRIPNVFLFMTKYAFMLIYIGFLLYGQQTGEWMYERFVWTGEISLMFVMMYFFYLYPRKRGVKIAFSLLLYNVIYQILYICTHASSVFTERFNTITL